MRGYYTLLILLLTIIASALSLNINVRSKEIDLDLGDFRKSPPVVPHSKKVKVENCGFAPVLNKKTAHQLEIINGYEIIPHSYPWLVALLDDDKYLCNGVIISDEWILSTAFCVHKIHYTDVIFGAHDLTKDEEDRTLIRTREIYIHENFTDMMHYNDISLIHLPTKLKFNDIVQPACLPAYSDPILPGLTMVNITAWGEDSLGQSIHQPYAAAVPVLTVEQCINFYFYGWDKFMCTDATGPKTSCPGDYGGPVNYKKTPDGPTYVRGVISFNFQLGCVNGPAGHQRVLKYLDWISDITGIAIDP